LYIVPIELAIYGYPSDVAALLQIVHLFSHAVLLTSELKAKVNNSVGDM